MSGKKSGLWLGCVALLLSLIAYTLGSAAFHPALIVTYISIPAAFLSYLLGASRMPILAVYFGALAWVVVPLSESLPLRIDYLLVFFFALGCILGVFLYANYHRIQTAN